MKYNISVFFKLYLLWPKKPSLNWNHEDFYPFRNFILLFSSMMHFIKFLYIMWVIGQSSFFFSFSLICPIFKNHLLKRLCFSHWIILALCHTLVGHVCWMLDRLLSFSSRCLFGQQSYTVFITVVCSKPWNQSCRDFQLCFFLSLHFRSFAFLYKL